LKIQSELRDIFESSSRSECLEEFVATNDIRTGLLEQYHRYVTSYVDPFLETLANMSSGSATNPGLEEVFDAFFFNLLSL